MTIGNIKYNIFCEIMLFIYTNQITDKISDKEFAKDLISAAVRFKLRDLSDAITRMQ